MKSLNRNRPVRVAVIGAAECSSDVYGLAQQTGQLIGENGGVLITGGRTGVMEAASKGASKSSGIVIGILPGASSEAANEFVSIPIATGLGHARNAVITQSADAVIAISGGHGTLSEIALALKMGKPVFGLNTWPDIPGVIYITDPPKAITEIFEHGR